MPKGRCEVASLHAIVQLGWLDGGEEGVVWSSMASAQSDDESKLYCEMSGMKLSRLEGDTRADRGTGTSRS